MEATSTVNAANGWSTRALIGRDYTPLMTEVQGVSKIVLSLALFTIAAGYEVSSAIEGYSSSFQTGIQSFHFFNSLGIEALKDGVLDVTALPQLGVAFTYQKSCQCIRATNLTDCCKRQRAQD